jgi:hypothetical protein
VLLRVSSCRSTDVGSIKKISLEADRANDRRQERSLAAVDRSDENTHWMDIIHEKGWQTIMG